MFEILKENSTMIGKQKKIANYLLEHPNEIVNMSIYELADLIDVSPASISRFCKEKLGMSFMDTKISLARQSKTYMDRNKEIIGWGCDIKSLPLNLIRELESMYKQLCILNKADLFETCINEIANSERVIIFGVGNSGIIAQDFFEKMIKIKKNVLYALDNTTMMATALMASEKDIIIAISNSGCTNEVIVSAKYAKERGAKIISITSNTVNPLRKLADYKILEPNIESNIRLGAIFSRYSGLFIEDILFIGVTQKILDNPEEVMNSFNELISKLHKK